jgi:hypothetical protein
MLFLILGVYHLSPQLPHGVIIVHRLQVVYLMDTGIRLFLIEEGKEEVW